MAQVWMKIRRKLLAGAGAAAGPDGD